MPENGRRRKAQPPPSPFIVSAGRSGTTLLRLMLDAHPELAIPPETHFIPAAARKVKAAKLEQINNSRRERARSLRCQPARSSRHRAEKVRRGRGEELRRGRIEVSQRAFVDVLTSWRTWDDHNITKEELRERVAAIEPFSISGGLRAFYELYAEKFGKPRWGDKTPNYAGSMRLIQRVLPEARFVYLIRDGRDVALSIKDLWFGPNSIEDAAEWWRFRVRSARSQAEKLPRSHYMEVRYENLVSEPVSVLKEVCAFIDLPWNTCMLEYHVRASERIKEAGKDVIAPDGYRTVRGREREALHSSTSKPPQRSHVGRWKKEMKEADRVRFEDIAGDLLEELGYEVGEGSGQPSR